MRPTLVTRSGTPLRNILILGHSAALRLPATVTTTIDVNDRFDAVLAVGPIDPSVWTSLLIASRDSLLPLLPVGDLGGNVWLPADVRAPAPTPAGVEAVLAEFQTLWGRLADLPDVAANADRDDWIVLALAQIRHGRLEPSWTPDVKATLAFPLLSARSSALAIRTRERLEALADLDLLERHFFARVHVCPGCASSRLSAYEACTECSSSYLAEDEIVHHFRCGHQAPEANFVQDRALVCPKCRRELRHFGVDYDKPGQILCCQACSASMTEPVPMFRCLDCGKAADGGATDTSDWFSYSLTESGRLAVLDGYVPHQDMVALAKPYHRAYSAGEFALLVGEAIRVAQRYERPLSAIVVDLTENRSPGADLGRHARHMTVALIIDVVAESLRDTDFFAAVPGHALLCILPETSPAQADSFLERLRSQLVEAVGAAGQIKVEPIAIEQTLELLRGRK